MPKARVPELPPTGRLGRHHGLAGWLLTLRVRLLVAPVMAGAVVVLSLAACGESTTRPAAFPSSPAVTASAASPRPSPKPSRTVGSLTVDSEAGQLLLTRQDVGSEWRGSVADLARESRTDNPACSGVERGIYSKGSARSLVSASWRYSDTEHSERLDHIVKVHPEHGAAAEIARVRAGVNRCRAWKEGGDAPGYDFTMSMQPVTAPRAGDEAVAWRQSSRYGRAPNVVTKYGVLLRVGEVTSIVQYWPGREIASSAAEKKLRELVAVAAARAEKAR